MASPDPPPPPTPSPQWLASGGFPMTAVCGVMMMDGEGWRGLTPTLLFWDVLWTDGHVVAHDPRWCSVPPAGRATVSPSLNYPLVHVRSDTCKRSPPLTHPEQKVLDHVPADPLLLLCQTSVRKSNSSSCCGRNTTTWFIQSCFLHLVSPFMVARSGPENVYTVSLSEIIFEPKLSLDWIKNPTPFYMQWSAVTWCINMTLPRPAPDPLL